MCYYYAQFACFSCRVTKNISRKPPKEKQFWFLADGTPYLYKTQRHKNATETGNPKCSKCAAQMTYVGPQFEGPPVRKIKLWKQLQYLK